MTNFFYTLGGLCGIIGSVIALMSIIIAMIVYPWSDFSWNVNSISSLGNVDKVQFPNILNFGLMIGGVLFFNFSLALLLFRTSRERIHTFYTWGILSFAIASLGVIGVGLFPSPNAIPHAISAIIAFVGMIIALWIFTEGRMQNWIALLAVISTFGLIYLIFAVVVDELGLSDAWLFGMPMGLASPELLIIIPPILWVIPTSVTLIQGRLRIMHGF